MHGDFPSCKAMSCSINNHHTCTSRFLALIILALLLAHPSNASWWTKSSTPGGGGGGSNLQVSARCRPEHAAALLQLKRSSFTFYVQDNTTLPSWIEGTDCCRWEGVACDRVFGSVTGLDLSDQPLGINGSGLHPALFSLTSLKHLVLDGNDFRGSHLPASGFERLKHLEELSLENCMLSGPFPPSFSGLHSLKTINLAFNNFNGSNFPLGITHLKKLEILVFEGMGLSGPIPSSIGNLSSLTELRLSWNDLSGGLPSSLSNLTYLSRLDCSTCGLSGRVPSLKNLSWLEFIDLSQNNLEGSVPFPLKGGHLDYSNNKFSSIISIDFVRQFRTASVINLANNELSGPIPYYTECQQDDNIGILDLSGNQLSGPVPPYLLRVCSSLLFMLNLASNNLSGILPDEMRESCSLHVIHLHGNQIQGHLPRSLASCKSLRHLDVGGNKFVDVFPSWLGSLPNLWLLVLRSNQFYGPLTMPGANNHSVENSYFSSLQIVDLAGNHFNGALPSEFFNVLKSMVRPQMSPDNIYMGNYSKCPHKYYPEGSYPVYSGEDSRARDLYSNYCDDDFYAFTLDELVKVQVSMKHLYLSVQKIIHDLVVIDLSDNRFSGCIPKTIGNLTALHVLNLSHNTLSGNIPAEFGRLSKVESLDLSWNNLTGSIPQAMASLTNLEVLNLAYNDLSGKIPTGSQFNTFPSSYFQGGNQGLYGCPLPIRCHLRQPTPAASAPAPPSSAMAMDRSFEAVILWLFVGSGYGIGIAVSIVLQMACCCRYMDDRLEKIANCIA